MEQRDALRTVQMQELRGRMDRATSEADCGEGAEGEQAQQKLMNDLDVGEGQAG
jgi:hypothetical protein